MVRATQPQAKPPNRPLKAHLFLIVTGIEGKRGKIGTDMGIKGQKCKKSRIKIRTERQSLKLKKKEMISPTG